MWATLHIVHLFEGREDFPCSHAFGIQGQNLVVHLGDARQMLLNQLRFEGVFTVTWYLQFYLAVIA